MLPVIVKLLLRRALLAVPLVLAVVTITFFFIRLAPGDPAAIMAGDAPTPEFLAQIRSEYGFDRPVWAQFLTFLGKAVTGDFGTSLYTKQPVFSVILERFPATVLMTGTAMIVASLIGILVGVASAKRLARSITACAATSPSNGQPNAAPIVTCAPRPSNLAKLTTPAAISADSTDV